MKRIVGRDAGSYAAKRIEFKNSNGQLYGVWKDNPSFRHYVVYSYGIHWPLFIYDPETGLWFENTSKYSSTTLTHRRYADPGYPTKPMTVDQMKRIDDYGYHNFAMERLTHAEG